VPVDRPYECEKLATAFESCAAVCFESGTLVDTRVTYIEG